MDEKGFMTGVVSRSKRVFGKRKFNKREVRASLQDGNHDWVTVIACVCADGGTLPPGVIYPAAGKAIKSSWVGDIDPRKHSVHFATSPSGWSNNDIGLAWLEKMFDRYTKAKARRKWRLLILDGHGSHVTRDFIAYHDDHKILLCILPPHSTHTLQPLDVVCFKPLSSNYKHHLAIHTHKTQGLLPMRKSEFFPIFWKAWVDTFTEKVVQRGFEVTGIAPLNPSIVVDKFTQELSEDSSADSNTSVYSGKDCSKLRHLYVVLPTIDAARIPGKSYNPFTIFLSKINSFMTGLWASGVLSNVRRSRQRRSTFCRSNSVRSTTGGGAVLWSPSKRTEAERLNDVVQRLDMDEKLKKTNDKKVAAARKLVEEKKKKKRQKREAREAADEVRRKEKEEHAKRVAERKAEREHQKQKRDAAKAIQLSQKGKRQASQDSQPEKKQKRSPVGDVGDAAPPALPPSPPHKITTRGRNVKLPAKYE
jgi:hypothetical protein